MRLQQWFQRVHDQNLLRILINQNQKFIFIVLYIKEVSIFINLKYILSMRKNIKRLNIIFMSYPQGSQRSMLLNQMEKAFKNVNAICKNYFGKVKNLNKMPQIETNSPRNFNNYKYSNQINPNKSSVVNIDQQSQSSSQADLKLNQNTKQYKTEETVQHPQTKIIEPKIKKPIPSQSKYSIIERNLTKQNIPVPPKSPLSPYFSFYKQKKDLIKQQFPDMSITQIASAAAKVWKSLSEQQKSPYTNKYWEQRRIYESLLNEYAKKYPDYKQIVKKAANKKK